MKSPRARWSSVTTAVITLLLIGSLAHQVDAQSRFSLFGRRKPAEAETVTYKLTQKAGPWLIMCAAFDGNEAEQDAMRLAEELRTKYKLKTYVYERQFDIGNQIADKGLGFAEPKAGGRENVSKRQMRLYNGQEVKTEFAVLVGDFAGIDDARAKRVLSGIKQLKPESLNRYSEGVETSSLSGSRLRAQSDALFGDKSNSSWTTINNGARSADQPLKFAFLLANPALPDEYFATNQVDQYVIKINTGLPNSLLNNKGLYSVKVASFAGKTTVNSGRMAELKNKKPTSTLMRCEQRASILAAYLRKQGLDAYEFHDRYESYVCVGSFDWVTKKRADGTVLTNPEVQKVVKRFQGRPASQQGFVAGYTLPGKLISAGITCDATPVPVVVPKVQVRRAGLGRFFK